MNKIAIFPAAILLCAALPAAAASPEKSPTASPRSVDVPSSAMSPSDRKALSDRFSKADLDHSGGLSSSELAKTPAKSFPNIKQRFREMDTDQNGEVTIKERDAWVTKAKSGR